MVISDFLKQKCILIMDRIMKRPCFTVFLNPVNPDEDGARGYYDVVRHPIDLSQIKQNLINNKYKDIEQWAIDMRHIWSNAEKFNKKESIMCSFALEFKKHFRKEYKLLKTYIFKKWTKEASNLKNKLDLLLDSPPDLISPYAIVSIKPEDEPIAEFSEEELSQLGRCCMLLSTKLDHIKLMSLITKYKIPIFNEGNIMKLDIHCLSNQALNELKTYISKRFTEMNLPLLK